MVFKNTQKKAKKRGKMEDIKIKLLLLKTDGVIAFIEFIQDGKSKILSYDNFIKRYGELKLSKIK